MKSETRDKLIKSSNTNKIPVSQLRKIAEQVAKKQQAVQAEKLVDYMELRRAVVKL